MRFLRGLRRCFLLVVFSLTASLLTPISAQANDVAGFFLPRPTFTDVSVGHSTACAVSNLKEVWCWGSNSKLQAYSRNSTFEAQPRKVEGLVDVVQVAVGREHTCALLSSKRVVCWGSNEFGQLGTGLEPTQLLSSAFPEYVNGVINVTKIQSGENHSCAITESKELFCWGSNSRGQVGQLHKDESRQIMGRAAIHHAERVSLAGVTDVGLGTSHTCAVTDKGYAYCWGSNLYGQLGQGWNVERSSTPLVVGTLTEVTEIDAGGDSVCAKTTGKSLRCWGSGTNGQLGNLDTVDLALPTNSNANLSKFAADKFSVGYRSICAKLDNSVVYCWGSNSFAQVGTSNATTNSLTPFSTIQYPSTDAIEIDSGSDFSCVLTTSVWCWGRNDSGQLGRISTSTSAEYAQINNLRWDLSPNAISHTIVSNSVTLTWPTIGFSQRYGRIEDLKGNLLCRTVAALTCDFLVQNVGPNQVILFLQVTDANGAVQGMRAEYNFTATTTLSSAEAKLKAEADAISGAAGLKLIEEEKARQKKEIDAKLAAAELARNVADKLATYKSDLSEESLDFKAEAKDRLAIAYEELDQSLLNYVALFRELNNLVLKLSKLKNQL